LKARLAIISLLNAKLLTLCQASLMNILDPFEMNLGLDSVNLGLEGDNVTAWDNGTRFSSWCSGGRRGETASQKEGYCKGDVLEVDHDER
jgi:hypothetical protein